MLTTGFFKSALEECADKSIQMFHITPSTEWKKKEKSANRKVSDKAEIKQIKKRKVLCQHDVINKTRHLHL